MRRTLVALAVVALGAPLVAQAQDYGPTYGEEVTPHHLMKPSIAVMGEAGVSQYDRHLNNETLTGPSYGAMVDLSPMRNLGVELGYAGAVNNISGSFAHGSRLVTNQVGGDLRINIVPATHDLPGHLKPFIFGGAFYHRIDLQGFAPGIKDNTNAFALPVGAGVEADLGKYFLVGGRLTYNFLFNEINQLGGRADFWTATVNLGARLQR